MKKFKVRFPISISSDGGEYHPLFDHFASIDVEAKDVKTALTTVESLLASKLASKSQEVT